MKQLLRPSIALFAFAAASANAEIKTVNSPEQLKSAIAQAKASDTILLNSGDYGSIQIGASNVPNDSTSIVTLVSSDPKRPAKFANLKIDAARNLRFENIEFRTLPASSQYSAGPLVTLKNCQNITFSKNTFEGTTAHHSAAKFRNGYPDGTGLAIFDSKQIVVSTNVLSNFSRAIDIRGGSTISVGSNEITKIRSYGIDVVGSTEIKVTNNHIHNFSRSKDETDSYNMIHFGTAGDQTEVSDVQIQDNFLDAGTGSVTQSILLGNETTEANQVAQPSFFLNVSIVGNVIRNGHIHGITVAAGKNIKIDNNTLLQVGTKSDAIDIPHILFDRSIRQLTVRSNLIPHMQREFMLHRKDWAIKDNHEIQRATPAAYNHYQNVFVNALAENITAVSDLAVQPQSLLATSGSSLLKFNVNPEIPTGYLESRAALKAGFKQKLTANIYGPHGKFSPRDVNSVNWDFGDSLHQQDKGLSINHHYKRRGTYNVVALVELLDHREIRVSKTLQVGY